MVAVMRETEQNIYPSGSGQTGGSIPSDGGNYKYETFIVTGGNINDLRNRAFPIYLTFRHDYVMAGQRVGQRVDEGAIVRFAMTRRRTVGFISYHMRKIAVDGSHLAVADIATIVVVPEHQTKGIGRRFFKDIAEENVPDVFTGVVQEPFTHVAKLKTGYCDMGDRREDDIYPLEVVRPLITVLGIGHRTGQVSDWRYGICAGYFPFDERARRLMIDKERHPEAHAVYEAWLKTGFRPEKGDGKRYWLPTVRERIIPREPVYKE